MTREARGNQGLQAFPSPLSGSGQDPLLGETPDERRGSKHMYHGVPPHHTGLKRFFLSQRKPRSPGSHWSLPAEHRHLWGEAVCAAMNKGGFLASALRDGWLTQRLSLHHSSQPPTTEATQAFMNKGCGLTRAYPGEKTASAPSGGRGPAL